MRLDVQRRDLCAEQHAHRVAGDLEVHQARLDDGIDDDDLAVQPKHAIVTDVTRQKVVQMTRRIYAAGQKIDLRAVRPRDQSPAAEL